MPRRGCYAHGFEVQKGAGFNPVSGFSVLLSSLCVSVGIAMSVHQHSLRGCSAVGERR